jgi:hypothetical protein
VLYAYGPSGGRPRDYRAASGDLIGQAHADEHFRDASYQEFYLAGLTPALATGDEDRLSSATEILVHRTD